MWTGFRFLEIRPTGVLDMDLKCLYDRRVLTMSEKPDLTFISASVISHVILHKFTSMSMGITTSQKGIKELEAM